MHSSDNHQLFFPQKPVKMGGESRQGCSTEGVRIVVGSGGGVDGGVRDEGGGVGGSGPNSLSRISTSASGINDFLLPPIVVKDCAGLHRSFLPSLVLLELERIFL